MIPLLSGSAEIDLGSFSRSSKLNARRVLYFDSVGGETKKGRVDGN
jgi:hypothetical protein